MTDRQFSTAAVRAGIDCDTAFGAVTPPIVLSTNFTFAGFGEKRTYDYSRSGNPTRDQLADALAELEGGVGAVVTASGLAAETLALHAMLKAGDRLLVPHDCYGGSWRLFDALSKRGMFALSTVDFTDAEALGRALAERPALVWIETPSNPLLRITDLESTIAAAHAVGALTIVDNTFLSPALQQPISLGADLVLHSTTKYINGHSDVVGGALVAKDKAVLELISWWANALGVTGSPFDSFLTLRGLRTLPARIRSHQENAAGVVEVLRAHETVSALHYPGLADHPGHSIAARQQRGPGGMISFELAGGEQAVRAFVDGLHFFSLAESLGGVESLVAHPATMTHAAMSADARERAGIGAGLLRLSVGIEDLGDLRADLGAALDRAAAWSQGSADRRYA